MYDLAVRTSRSEEAVQTCCAKQEVEQVTKEMTIDESVQSQWMYMWKRIHPRESMHLVRCGVLLALLVLLTTLGLGLTLVLAIATVPLGRLREKNTSNVISRSTQVAPVDGKCQSIRIR